METEEHGVLTVTTCTMTIMIASSSLMLRVWLRQFGEQLHSLHCRFSIHTWGARNPSLYSILPDFNRGHPHLLREQGQKPHCKDCEDELEVAVLGILEDEHSLSWNI